ncbi:MAG: M48 family metalloprotease [Armatimonadetes bacterium]|nr:M48 family metalloprotease [Armatimonadota bacterium]
MRMILPALLLALLATGVSADPTFFLRHRTVEGRVVGQEIYVPLEALGQYLREEELRRVEIGPSEVRLPEGDPVAVSDGQVPLVQLVRGLGYEVRPNRELQAVDLIPPTALLTHDQRIETLAVDSRRRPDYALAGSRMERVLEVLPLSRDQEASARVERIGRKVASATPLAGLDWKFRLVDTSIPNAASTGEGFVFVTSGLLDLGITDDELAGVLGHEIAHGIRRHPFLRLELVRELDDFIREYYALQREIAEYEADLNHKDYIRLKNRAEQYEKKRIYLEHRIANLRLYDHRDEEEADMLGLRYAVTAGYSPDGLGSCLLKLQETSLQYFGTAVLDEDMSHPPVPRRLEILRKVRAEWNR